MGRDYLERGQYRLFAPDFIVIFEVVRGWWVVYTKGDILPSHALTAVDQLCSASWRGYVRAEAAAGCNRQQHRDELAELLLSDRSDTITVQAAAVRAGWSLPRRAAVVLISPDSDIARALLDRLGDSCLRLRRPQMLLSIVPGPAGPGWRNRLVTALSGVAAVVGHAVPLDRLS
jgi:hypothetical protein